MTEQAPAVFVMTRVNVGDSPTPAISMEAVYKTADLFESNSSNANSLWKDSLEIAKKQRVCLPWEVS